MSHFTVMVIGEDVEKQLAPYHEFECTGQDDEYVIDIDETQERKEEYEADTAARYKDSSGVLHYPYDDKFYRDPTEEEKPKMGAGSGFGGGLSWNSKDWGDGKGYRAKIHFIPDGWEKTEVPYTDVMSFLEYMNDYCSYPIKRPSAISTSDSKDEFKYSYVEVDSDNNILKVINRTNPNAKWDWYQVGGRWTGFFKLKTGLRWSRHPLGGHKNQVGTPGLMTEPAKAGYVDSSLKDDIDFDGMRNEAQEKETMRYEKAHSIMGDSIKEFVSWNEVREELFKGYIEKARDFYHDQKAVKALKSDEDLRWSNVESFHCAKEECIQRARNSAVSAHAVVKDGKWYEKGKMGWWACVSNEKDDWSEEFAKLLDSVPDETRLTIIDCHI